MAFCLSSLGCLSICCFNEINEKTFEQVELVDFKTISNTLTLNIINGMYLQKSQIEMFKFERPSSLSSIKE